MFDIKHFRKVNNLSQTDIADLFECKQSFVSQVESGKRPLPDAFIEILRSKFGNIIDAYNYKQDQEVGIGDFKGVPYYDIDVTGGIVESFSDVKEKPDFFVDFKPFNDCAAYMPIFGDSMFPMFASGEILAVKQMHNYDAILWGEPYLVVTNAEWDNLRTVKLVHPHDEQDKIILRASNPNFKGDTVVPKTAIVGLFIVKGKINRRQL